jgi:23S rRNA (adenine2503-C2)-methyltransferase
VGEREVGCAEVAAADFHQRIQECGIPCTIRQRRGIDVAAGCGQLKADRKKRTL